MTRFSPVDAILIVVYLAGVTIWGAWLGRGQKGGSDYFLGSRDLPWWAVMLSVVATETSTLTFLSIPGVSYLGTLGFLQLTLGYLAGRMVVATLLLPAYFRGQLTTAYALLEARFGTRVRKLTSAIFMLTRLLADSVRLFATAIPLAIITGWPYPLSIGVIGVLTVIYTYFGGIKAVVWVDSLQMVLYLAGGLVALAVFQAEVPGGWPAILEQASDAAKLTVFDFSFTLSEPYTFWAGLIGAGFLSMASHGTDQLIVQRLFTCRDLRSSQKALVGSGVVVIAQFFLFLMVGIGLWAFYEGRAFERSDEIFARFIIESLPVGVTGILIAGVFAAAMSSLSSSVNSLASATAYDFWAPLTGRSNDDEAVLRAGRILTLVWAGLLILGAVLFIPLSRAAAAVEVALGVASMVYGGLLGAFGLGVLVDRADARGATVGLVVGIGTIVLLWTFERQALAWPWFTPAGFLVTLTVGALVSRGRKAGPVAVSGGEGG